MAADALPQLRTAAGRRARAGTPGARLVQRGQEPRLAGRGDHAGPDQSRRRLDPLHLPAGRHCVSRQRRGLDVCVSRAHCVSKRAARWRAGRQVCLRRTRRRRPTGAGDGHAIASTARRRCIGAGARRSDVVAPRALLHRLALRRSSRLSGYGVHPRRHAAQFCRRALHAVGQDWSRALAAPQGAARLSSAGYRGVPALVQVRRYARSSADAQLLAVELWLEHRRLDP